MSDFELVDDPIFTGKRGHGGARSGAGRKPKDYEPPAEKLDYEVARARNESAKADLAELDFRRKSGEVVDRGAVRQASAHAWASAAQALRAVPDMLERKCGLAPEQAEAAAAVIDAVLNDLADEFELMTVFTAEA